MQRIGFEHAELVVPRLAVVIEAGDEPRTAPFIDPHRRQKRAARIDAGLLSLDPLQHLDRPDPSALGVDLARFRYFGERALRRVVRHVMAGIVVAAPAQNLGVMPEALAAVLVEINSAALKPMHLPEDD